jgi:hypothetical protein
MLNVDDQRLPRYPFAEPSEKPAGLGFAFRHSLLRQSTHFRQPFRVLLTELLSVQLILGSDSWYWRPLAKDHSQEHMDAILLRTSPLLVGC